MAIPKIQELYNAILAYLMENGETELSKIREEMAPLFYVPDDEAFEKGEQKYSVFENRVNYACWDLCHAGLIERTRIGFYELSPEGSQAVSGDNHVDRDYLWDIPEFQNYFLSHKEDSVEEADGQESKENVNKAKIVRPPKLRTEFVPIEHPSILQIMELERQDTRFANMISTGCYMYADGMVMEVPEVVMAGEMTYGEYKAQNGEYGSAENVILCMEDANGSGKMKAVPPKKCEGTHYGPRKKTAWANPHPLDSGNMRKNYPAIIEALEYARQNHTFGEYLKYLIDEVYKIEKTELAARSGVNKKTIDRMISIDKRDNTVEYIFAISFALQLHPDIVEELLRLANHNPKSPQCHPYMIIYKMASHATYEEVNAMCVQAHIEEIFPHTLTGQIA
nr:winged helix-turn-helix domain-containing protein [uncultured Acetatifactor sp.]